MQEISDRAKQVAEVATALSDRLERFEEKLAKMHGRVAFEHADEKSSLCFRFARYGQAWKLYVSASGTGDDARPMLDLSLTTKMQVVPLIPALLNAMYAAQAELIRQLQDSVDLFDRTVDIGTP